MTFSPNPNDPVTINGVIYHFMPHPATPSAAYGQEGRAGTVYQLRREDGSLWALKVFKARHRQPALVGQAERIAPMAELPGLMVCQRTVLTPSRHAAVIREHPDLIYAVLMPWVQGSTWQEVMLAGAPWERGTALMRARQLAEALQGLEERGIAHCDPSGANLILTEDAVQLVDVEGMYAPGLVRPDPLMGGSPGYGHRTAGEGIWRAEGDRFGSAVLLAEMLSWVSEEVRTSSWGESYFDPQELQTACTRLQTLQFTLKVEWGEPVAALLQRAWVSDSLVDCPTLGEWLVALPESVPQAHIQPEPEVALTVEVEPEVEVAAPRPVSLVTQMLQAAQGRRDAGDLDGARAMYAALLALPELTGGQRREVEALLTGEGRVRQTDQRIVEVESATHSLQGRIERETKKEPRQALKKRRLADTLLTIKQKDKYWGVLVVALVFVVVVILWSIRDLRAPAMIPPTPTVTSTAIPIPTMTPTATPDPLVIRPEQAVVDQIAMLRTLKGHTRNVYSVAFSPDGQVLASGSDDQTIKLWRVSDGMLLRILEGHNGNVKSVAFSSDGQMLASGSNDNTIKLWRVSDGVLLKTLEGHTVGVTSVAFSPDGQTLASGSWDKTIKLWRISDGVLMKTLEGYKDVVMSVAFSPDGQTLASGPYDYKIKLWRVSDGTLLRTLEGSTEGVTSVAFSPDGQTLASGSLDDKVRLWRVSDGTLLRTLEGHITYVNSVAFSPDGQTLASGSCDHVVRLWRVSDGMELTILGYQNGDVWSVAFSPNGQTLAFGSNGGIIQIWGIPAP